jgi:LmbE family N-acetylglucosaminyl deacetylase
LRDEIDAEITNFAITLGSDEKQRPRRRVELEASCSVLGFDLLIPLEPTGLEGVTPAAKKVGSFDWSRKVDCVAEILDRKKPKIVLLPHAKDFHPTHIGTHLLVMDALKKYQEGTANQSVILVETEYWHELVRPNLLVGLQEGTVATLVMAVAEHGGEVSRNPYHVRLPARLVDNVRRGAEVVGGPGARGCDFTFGELYRVSLMKAQRIQRWAPMQQIIGPDESMREKGLI